MPLERWVRMKTWVISPIGEPGSGKSTFSFWLVQALKLRGVRAEFVPEVIKYESYSDAAKARVMTGHFDTRMLRRQHAFTKPLIGATEVIVNDGSLPLFLYYSLQRVPADRLPAFRELYARYEQEQQPAEHRYVSVLRKHNYDPHGRRQTEVESDAMRAHLLSTIEQELGIVPEVLGDWPTREHYLDALVAEVMAERVRAGEAE